MLGEKKEKKNQGFQIYKQKDFVFSADHKEDFTILKYTCGT